MTWSLLAKDPNTPLFGLAVASKFFAVGAVCPYGSPAGVAMSQARVNPELGFQALDHLKSGLSPDSVIAALKTGDPGFAYRQAHVMDTTGASAAHTGSECTQWAGSVSAPGISVAGNMLTGPEVVEATMETFVKRADLPWVERLLTAMEAGEAAGGDMRGRQSAALRVQGPENFPRLDIRADDHPDPFAELRRLYDVSREIYLPFAASMPRADRPLGITDTETIEKISARDAGKHLSYHTPLPED